MASCCIKYDITCLSTCTGDGSTHLSSYRRTNHACEDPGSFVRGGPTLTTFFFILREDPNTTPPAKRHLNGVSLAYRGWPYIECWLRSFV